MICRTQNDFSKVSDFFIGIGAVQMLSCLLYALMFDVMKRMGEAFTNKLRLAIISALVTGEKSFKELQHFTDATSGNLGAQLVKLEELGYINCKKEFINRKPQSTYQLTEKGLSVPL